MNLVPEAIRAVMAQLEARDTADRADGTPIEARLRAIRPEVGELILTLALATDARLIVEVGTGAGYSTLWLALAAMQSGGRVVTFETSPLKVDLARRTFEAAGIERLVELRETDGRAGLEGFSGAADLVFLDAEKNDYLRLLEPSVEALRPGGMLVADNLISHATELAGFRAAALAHRRLSGLVVPIGRGELVAVRL